MHKTALLITIFLFFSVGLQAQHKIEVPSQIRFADMRLSLTPQARKKIQTDVDALTRHEKYFNAKVEKVDAHLPLIEKVLREEKVPDDIKYLVIQESALVGDAVSTSNAVGYWQFKEATGREVGLKIDKEVDERMNIVTATRGAAQYFKNNNTYFDNWLYALLAYYAGPGGALKIADKKYYGKREMKLDGSTHWYVLKYLAHKIAFENAVNQNPKPEMLLFTYTKGNGKTLAQVAAEFDLQGADLEPYNRWVRKNRIPDDKLYYVIIPDYSGRISQPLLAQTPEAPSVRREPETFSQATEERKQEREFVEADNTDRFPIVRQATRWGKKQTLINNVPGTIAEAGENIRKISQRTDVAPSRLVKYNDLTSRESAVKPGTPYYLKPKRNKGPAHYHVVEPKETLWSVSQRFGIKLKKLMRNNRIVKEQPLKPGRVLWLRFIRPPHIPVEYREVPISRQAPPISQRVEKKRPVRVVSQVVKPQANAPQDKKPAEDRPDLEASSAGDYRQEKPSTPSSEQPGQTPIPDPAPRQAKPTSEKVPEEEKELVPVLSEQRSENDKKTYHTVQAGETLYSIAQQYDITIPQLTSYNNIEWEVPLAIGQRLRLTPTEELSSRTETSASSTGSFFVHKVAPGETLYGIARQYEVTIKDLTEWNDKDDFNVSVGEALKIREK